MNADCDIFRNQPYQLYELKALHPLSYDLVAVGAYHSVLVANSNNLFTWGGNDHGQLGHGNINIIPTPTPTQVNTSLLQGKVIKQVVAGETFTVIQTMDNILVGMGDKSIMRTTFDSAVPIIINHTITESIREIHAGGAWLLALTESFEVYYWGSTQLHDVKEVQKINTSIFEDGERFQSVSVGARHALFLTNIGKVYAFGYNHFNVVRDSRMCACVYMNVLLDCS